MELFADYRERRSDSPLVERVQQARVATTGSTIRPAEIDWHMVLARYRGEARLVLAGPLTISGVVSVPDGAELLQQGASILDTVFDAGYSDQPHLTRSLKHWIGHTPGQLSRLTVPE